VTPRLFLAVAGVEARRKMAYRVDFWLTALVGIAVEFALAWFLWRAVFEATGADRIGGYGREALVAYSLAAVLVSRLVRGPEFEGVLSQEIYEGALSRALVYPVPYAGLKYAQHVGWLAPYLLQAVLLALAALLLLPLPEGVRITPLSLAMAVASLVVGNALHFLISFPVQAVAFWAENVWSLAVTQRLVVNLLGGFLVPLAVFPDWSQEILRWLPFRLFFQWPVETLLGRLSFAAWLEGLLLALAWGAAIGLLSWGVWRRGRLRYTGVGM
jgi:ABC-2 type transport system permease protein